MHLVCISGALVRRKFLRRVSIWFRRGSGQVRRLGSRLHSVQQWERSRTSMRRPVAAGAGNPRAAGRGQILPLCQASDRRLKLVGAPLPPFDLQIVADGDVVEPIGPVLAEPHLAVLALQGGVGVAQILAAAVVAADLAQQIVRWQCAAPCRAAGPRPGHTLRRFPGQAET